MSARGVAAAAAFLPLALAGCKALGFGGEEERWESARVEGIGADDLWTLVGTSVARDGFRRLEVDREKGTGTSAWLVSLYPYSGGGWRERAHVRLEPAGERAWKIGVRIEREKNETVRRPLVEAEAEWEPDADDAERARIVARRIGAALGAAPSSGAGGGPR